MQRHTTHYQMMTKPDILQGDIKKVVM